MGQSDQQGQQHIDHGEKSEKECNTSEKETNQVTESATALDLTSPADCGDGAAAVGEEEDEPLNRAIALPLDKTEEDEDGDEELLIQAITLLQTGILKPNTS